MPVVLNGSIPLPSIRVYTSASILLVSICLYYACSVTSDPFWRQQSNATAAAPTILAAGTGGAAVAAGEAAAGAVANAGPAAAAGGVPKLDSVLTAKEIDDLEEKILAATDADLQRMMADEAELLESAVANDSRSIGAHLKDIASFMGSEPVCIWVSTRWLTIDVYDKSNSELRTRQDLQDS